MADRSLFGAGIDGT